MHADYKSVLSPYFVAKNLTSRIAFIHRDRCRFFAFHLESLCTMYQSTIQLCHLPLAIGCVVVVPPALNLGRIRFLSSLNAKNLVTINKKAAIYATLPYIFIYIGLFCAFPAIAAGVTHHPVVCCSVELYERMELRMVAVHFQHPKPPASVVGEIDSHLAHARSFGA